MISKLEEIKKIIFKNKKTIIKSISIICVSGFMLVTLSGLFIYSTAKKNINYTIEEAKEIALKSVNGDILKVNKKLEVESLSFEYEFKIKDNNNILREVTVDSNLGVITDLD
ncbi:hypothetical protein H9660_13645 [Clostridium sp. Sa3CUN1]|uniref:PepSY domain-containing protein n=1 Tax=Clostridium gallinarum TaxID=2762246 RepID=A0ABR8Q6Y4_9CLOT|nr:PepSY domain-containing protein [Clostridium gallinarum]MBD7916189.1 hypothetical protein [Clostridium gallinarum]